MNKTLTVTEVTRTLTTVKDGTRTVTVSRPIHGGGEWVVCWKDGRVGEWFASREVAVAEAVRRF